MTASKLIVPAILVPFIAWRVYARYRRNVGRQPFNPRSLTGRIIFFSVISLIVIGALLNSLPALGAFGGGLAVSVLIAWISMHLTRFEKTPQGEFYTPNTYIGVGLTLLLFARIAYRMFVVFSATPEELRYLPPPFQSPMTLFILGITAGYYIAYYTGILIRGKRDLKNG